MDRPYIKETVSAYLIDNDLEKSEEEVEELNNYLIESIEYMKSNFECAYVTLHEMNRIQQQRYIYNVLELKNIEEEKNTDLELVEELDPFSIGATLGVMGVTVLASIWLDKSGYNLLMKVSDWFTERKVNKLKKILKSKQDIKRFEITRKIVGSNFSDCRRKCGIFEKGTSREEEDLLRAITYKRTAKVFGSKISGDFSPDEIDNAICLRDCYIDYIISTIATLSTIYSKCLNETGELSNQISSDHGMGALLSYPTGENCQVLYDQLKDQHDAFIDVVNVFFKDDPRERQIWVKRLDEKVRGAKRGEHLRPSAPRRDRGSFNKQGKFVTGKEKGLRERYINPSAQFKRQ